MTNSEYFEKNNVPFAKAMEIFNTQKNKKEGTKSFDKFLASEHVEHKFKVGDLVVLQLTPKMKSRLWTKNVVFEVVDIESSLYLVKALTPDTNTPVGEQREFTISTFEDNFVLY